MLLILTGGTGSLCKAIIAEQDLLKSNGITKIRVLSRDEQKQVSLIHEYEGDIQLDCYLADVTDKERMEFGLKDADYVIHAAALKHIDKFELDVKTGYKTNIIGTENVAQAFLKSPNARSGIFVSTDKAALPITAYGVSKLAAEHMWLWHNSFQKNVAFGVTRYGNIFGSRGSIIERWTRLAQLKKPLPITDKCCTRFFMMIDDAAKFVLNAIFSKSHSMNIPWMKSSEMITIAQMIWDYWNPEKEFQYAVLGMRSIEKIHEILDINGKSSFDAERFTQDELRGMYKKWLESSPK